MLIVGAGVISWFASSWGQQDMPPVLIFLLIATYSGIFGDIILSDFSLKIILFSISCSA